MSDEAQNIPGEVSIAEGVVILDGPGQVTVSMTAEAARTTAERLLGASVEVFACRAAEE